MGVWCISFAVCGCPIVLPRCVAAIYLASTLCRTMLVAAFPRKYSADIVLMCLRSLLELGFSLLHVRAPRSKAQILRAPSSSE